MFAGPEKVIVDELWRFAPATELNNVEWHLLNKQPQGPSPGSVEDSVLGSLVVQQTSYSMARVGSNIYVNERSNALEDLWILSTVSMEWTHAPGKNKGGQLVSVGDDIYTFSVGMWHLNPTTLEWTRLNNTGSVSPAERIDYAMTAVGDHLYLFAGRDQYSEGKPTSLSLHS